MTNRDQLIEEINELPDYLIKQIRDIVHYVKLGIDYEEQDAFKSLVENEFYNSSEFKNIVSDAVTELKKGKTEDMDVLENEIKKNKVI
jgi:hypothetical protein